MLNYGLIGEKLSHSFSKKYFANKFEKEKISNRTYNLYELSDLSEFSELWKDDKLVGLNVTIPYKTEVIKYLDKLDKVAEIVGAVNTIKRKEDKLVGYNTDVFGFQKSLVEFLDGRSITSALVLGTGGASKAISYVLDRLDIEYLLVSRVKGDLLYQDLNKKIIQEVQLIINTTPLGMYPNIDLCPLIPYSYLNEQHFLFDLIYNPENTLFLKLGMINGARIKNGYDMLVYQAEKSWTIWNQ